MFRDIDLGSDKARKASDSTNANLIRSEKEPVNMFFLKIFAFINTFFTVQKELNRKREAKVKAELAGKQDKINEYK
jgi:hypothetical protein